VIGGTLHAQDHRRSVATPAGHRRRPRAQQAGRDRHPISADQRRQRCRPARSGHRTGRPATGELSVAVGCRRGARPSAQQPAGEPSRELAADAIHQPALLLFGMPLLLAAANPGQRDQPQARQSGGSTPWRRTAGMAIGQRWPRCPRRCSLRHWCQQSSQPGHQAKQEVRNSSSTGWCRGYRQEDDSVLQALYIPSVWKVQAVVKVASRTE
jgi:hypothetical protein